MIYGELRRWTGPDTFITLKSNAQASHELEVRTGALLWLPETGGILIDTIETQHIDQRVFTLSIGDGWVTRNQYRMMVKDKRETECPANAPVMKTDANAPAHLAPLLNLGVRFF